MITKILFIVLMIVIIKSIKESFISSNFIKKEKTFDDKEDLNDDIIDVDYEEVD